ncbi:GNAT family N-acetyltransferase [Limimaricola hongkongensis]|uniref:MobC protein n=1 Tax=Limimaricola hongkongensis DSM 17492 TaxID=1122180 RepID=A0A017HE55_9RHOB|nr:GNAT family N-acetyltransferase [Limimaricola hongkongensis]EYD72039.1 MobC protein [Limimaricola hongkongensis DSM 17492]
MKIAPGFAAAERPRIAALYWEAFGPKLGRVLGPRPRALRFIEVALDPAHALCAREADGTLLGVAGFKTAHGALVSGGLRGMRAAYGGVGATWRAGLLALLETDVDNRRFLIDGIFVAPEARGRGVGSRLIEALAQEARMRGHAEIRLEVIDENPRARALYERRGFVAAEHHPLGPLRMIFGFRAATTMIRRLG